MGTRVAILCTDGKSVSVEVYKHYDGCDAPEIIARANSMSPMRPIKPEQASALVAACAVNIEIDQAREFEATFDGKLTGSSPSAPPAFSALKPPQTRGQRSSLPSRPRVLMLRQKL